VSAATGDGNARKDTTMTMAAKPRKALLSLISLFLLFIVTINLSSPALSIKQKPTFMGRFHYWLGTSQVAKLRPVLHRLPFDVLIGSMVYCELSFILYLAEA
jgi:hypothetical protein